MITVNGGTHVLNAAQSVVLNDVVGLIIKGGAFTLDFGNGFAPITFASGEIFNAATLPLIVRQVTVTANSNGVQIIYFRL